MRSWETAFTAGNHPMSKPSPRPKPNPLRVWLKQAIHSGTLERIPRHYSPGAGGSHDTIDYARDLLAELRDPDTSARPLDAIVDDAVRFRRWVESRQQVSRRIILAESRPGEGYEPEPPRPARDDRERRPERDQRAPRQASPRSDPMWDELLDGLGL
jgi:hypothetical protein